MNNYYLRFTNEAEFRETFLVLNLASIEPIFGTESDTQFVPKVITDVIGLIYTPTGNVLQNEEGLQYPEMKPLEGYHVNIKADLEDDILSQLPTISVANPVRKWAGE